MKVRKFFGANSRAALSEVKRVLGSDAVILANRAVEGGVELTALANEDVVALEPSRPGARNKEPEPRELGSGPRRDGEPIQIADAWVETLMGEIKSMRGILESQLAGLVWGDMQRHEPVKSALMRELLANGFSPLLGRRLIENLPAGLTQEQGAKWVKSALARNVLTANEEKIVAQGGVYALMGPTGVGKTTTTAKLAARCVVRHGADKLALLTTDGYRVGAHEQLRIFGKILGVPVHAVHEASDLRITLEGLKNRHMVLIDTIGMSQRDRMVAEQVGMLCGCGEVKRLLLLNATSSGETLDDVVRAYQGAGLFGAIVTKVDEAVKLGPVLDVLIRHRLTVHYVANGQRVPEDLHLANRDYLLHRALRPAPGNSPFAIADLEVPLMLAAEWPGVGAANLHAPGG